MSESIYDAVPELTNSSSHLSGCSCRDQSPCWSDRLGNARGLPAMMAMAGAVVVPCTMADLLGNRVLMAGFAAWFAAQFGKVRMGELYQEYYVKK